MNYMGYDIVREGSHVKVTAPDGVEWTEDTFADARQEIREVWALKTVNKPIDTTFDTVVQ